MRERRRLWNRQTLAVSLVLVALAALSYWLMDITESVQSTSDNKPGHDPDYTVENFIVTAMDATGKPEHRLEASSMIHYADDGSSEFTKPHMTVFREASAPWQIYSQRAWMSADQTLILLRDDVLIENPTAPTERALHLTTRDLRVLPDDRYAETGEPVTITSQRGVTHAIGMRAHLKEGRLQLLAKVRGRYEPKNP